jgi:hypothetical protein
MNKKGIAETIGILKDDRYALNDETQSLSIDSLINTMNKEQAIEVIEDFVNMMKQTYSNIAFGSWGFCTSEKEQNPDEKYGDSDDKRYVAWPSCNECSYDIRDGYDLLDKSLKVIKGENNDD